MADVPLHLALGPEPVLAFLHEPAGAARDPAVLLLGPFGWEDVCSYRARRDWATHLAARGHTTLRLDLPGSGDSSRGPRDPRRVAAWAAATAAAVAWLRAHAGAGRLAVVGLGLGGLLGAHALADGAPVDDLVLWGVPARGRALVRELRAFALLEATQFPGIPATSDDALVAGGFVLTAETRAALEALDLLARPLPARRALLLEREAMGVDDRLREHLEASGADAVVAPGPGWAAMMVEPQFSRAPEEVFRRVDAWLEPVAAPAGSPAGAVAGLDGLALPDVRETPFAVPGCFGVLAEPDGAPTAELTAVLLNAGGQRRIGPNRMWVEAARRWAGRGVPTLRLDLDGLGDAPGDPTRYMDMAGLYVPELVGRVRHALDALADRGLPGAFAVGGLCSGAYWAFHAALEDPRVTTVLALNPRVLFWHDGYEADWEAGKARKLTSGRSWRRLARGEISSAQLRITAAALARHALVAPAQRRERRGAGDLLPAALDKLRARDVQTLLAFSAHEPLHEKLKREGRLTLVAQGRNVELAALPGAVHTLRPLVAQAAAHEALDAGLERGLRHQAGLNSELVHAD